MNNNLYVGNLAFHTTAGDLTQVFGHYGTVVQASVVTNPDTGESRGFGYVEMSEGGDQAVVGLAGSLYQGRPLTVHQAKMKDYFWPDGDDRESIPVMPGYQFRGWPTPIIDAPSNEEESWDIYDSHPATRDAEAYCASENVAVTPGLMATEPREG